MHEALDKVAIEIRADPGLWVKSDPWPHPGSRIGRPGRIFRNVFAVRSPFRAAGRLAHSSACERIRCAATSLPVAWIRLREALLYTDGAFGMIVPPAPLKSTGLLISHGKDHRTDAGGIRENGIAGCEDRPVPLAGRV